jgi:Zn-dependent membrane protease YugP
MIALGAVLVGLLVLLSYWPSYWAQKVLRENAQERTDLPGTGAEFADHMLRKLGIQGVTLEEGTSGGDHYDPMTKTVRLSPEYFHGKSLTAVVVAAHEVGHAYQHATHFDPLLRRLEMAQRTQQIERLSGLIAIGIPFMTILSHSPLVGMMMFAVGVATMLSGVILHINTLPVETDASFNRALPFLREGGYLNKADMKKAQTILRACAYTYLAGALSSLLNVFKWMKGLRR